MAAALVDDPEHPAGQSLWLGRCPVLHRSDPEVLLGQHPTQERFHFAVLGMALLLVVWLASGLLQSDELQAAP
jgi:hypothetical protein